MKSTVYCAKLIFGNTVKEGFVQVAANTNPVLSVLPKELLVLRKHPNSLRGIKWGSNCLWGDFLGR